MRQKSRTNTERNSRPKHVLSSDGQRLENQSDSWISNNTESLLIYLIIINYNYQQSVVSNLCLKSSRGCFETKSFLRETKSKKQRRESKFNTACNDYRQEFFWYFIQSVNIQYELLFTRIAQIQNDFLMTVVIHYLATPQLAWLLPGGGTV